MKIILATQNKGKLVEMKYLLGDLDVKLDCLPVNIVEEPEEDGDSFEENAIIKAEFYSDMTASICMSDDSGLVIPYLDGDPGIYSARWAGEKKDFSVAIDRIYRNLLQKGIDPVVERVDAYFYCSVAFKVPGEKVIVFGGRVDGRIIFPARGSKGFGYDPIFVPEGSDLSFGEMSFEQKNSDNHRSKAINKLKDYINCCNNDTMMI